MALRATVGVPIAVLLFVVLHGAFGLGRDTTPRIHSLRNPMGCTECHVSGESRDTRADEPALCRRCHAKVGVSCEEGGEPSDLACSSCHDPHGKVGGPHLLR